MFSMTIQPLSSGITSNFLDDDANCRVFNNDLSQVHSFILHFISKNKIAEQKALPYKDDNNSRSDFMALKEFYEGVGANTKATTLAVEADIQDMLFTGEKLPHVWWDEF